MKDLRNKHAAIRFSREFLLCLFITCIVPVCGLGQMYNNQTVYTDFSISGATIHAWGYTYAPSGNNLQHTYKAKTKILLPSGYYQEITSTGSGYNAATANVYLTVPLSDIINDLVGSISVTTQHQAFCPAAYGGTVPFLSSTSSIFGISLATTTSQHSSSITFPNGTIACYAYPVCWNTSTPKCGGLITHVRAVEEGCCSFYKSGWIVTGGACFLGLHLCVSGPTGYCTPL